ncbi:MAG: ATP-binding cassette domain-containing protein [Flavobacteriales bacterium]|nr:ATP-binding cassette domain-containing protein [Flavobacteriales bacterium]
MEETKAIKVSNLGKRYTIGKQKNASLRSTLSNVFKSAAAKGDDFWAIRDINFEINRGDIVGIIGKNGAGKSTLLKVLSQITKPTTGRIEINGRVASLLEVGTGFHPELTGRENIYLNGTILGMTRKEVKEKFNDIVEFSGVKQFIDTPVKHYSSGMYVRLAFSVAAHLEPEILIIDEVLAVGDAEFQKKCIGKMSDVAAEGRTVLFVSHDMGAISSLCTKGFYLEKGTIIKEGPVDEVVEHYLNSSTKGTDLIKKYKEFAFNEWDEKVVLHNVKLINEQKEEILNATIDQTIGIQVEFEVLDSKGVYPIPNIHISNSLGGKLLVSIAPNASNQFSSKGKHFATAWIPKNFLNNNYFKIGVAITTFSPFQVHVSDYDAINFEVLDSDLNSNFRNGYVGKIDGLIRPDLYWEFENND